MIKSAWAIEGSMDYARRSAVINAIDFTKGNLSEAARRLIVGRSTLYRLLIDLNVSVSKRPSTIQVIVETKHHTQRIVQRDGDFFLED